MSPLRQRCRELCPAVLGTTEADWGDQTHHAPEETCWFHSVCSPSACSSPWVPPCGCPRSHAAASTFHQAALWSPSQAGRSACPGPRQTWRQAQVQEAHRLGCPKPQAELWHFLPHEETSSHPDPTPCRHRPGPQHCSTTGMLVASLVPLAWSLGAWLVLPSPFRWLLQTIRLGDAIQFARRPPKFRGIRFTSVKAIDAPVLHAEIVVLSSFLGIELDSVNQTSRFTQECAQSVLNYLKILSGRTAVPLKLFPRLLGHMASAKAIVPLGLLHMSTGSMAEYWGGHGDEVLTGFRLHRPATKPSARGQIPRSFGQKCPWSRYMGYSQIHWPPAGELCTMGTRCQGYGRVPNCVGISNALSCWQYALPWCASEGAFRARTF